MLAEYFNNIQGVNSEMLDQFAWKICLHNTYIRRHYRLTSL